MPLVAFNFKTYKRLLFLLTLLRLHTRYPFSTACKSSQYFYFTGMFFCFFIITDSNRQYAPGISFPFRHLSLEPQSIFFLFNLRNRFFRCMIYLQFEITVLYLSYGSLLFKNCPMFYGLLLMLHVLSESFCA